MVGYLGEVEGRRGERRGTEEKRTGARGREGKWLVFLFRRWANAGYDTIHIEDLDYCNANAYDLTVANAESGELVDW